MRFLETKILELMNACMPLRTVKMSSRDPSSMSPFIKYLLKIKAKVTSTQKDRMKLINERVSKAIIDNRLCLNSSYGIGSREWWKITNTICSYKTSSHCTLSETEIKDLNCFFGKLCTDKDYHKPEFIPVPYDAKIPRISEM